jgi:hypothetical protein
MTFMPDKEQKSSPKAALLIIMLMSEARGAKLLGQCLKSRVSCFRNSTGSSLLHLWCLHLL